MLGGIKSCFYSCSFLLLRFILGPPRKELNQDLILWWFQSTFWKKIYATEPRWKQYVLTPSMSPILIPAVYGNPPLTPFPAEPGQWWGSTICHWTQLRTVSVDTFTGSNSNPGCIWQPYSQQNLTKKPLNVDLFLPQHMPLNPGGNSIFWHLQCFQ